MCEVCSNGAAPYINSKLIAKANLNIAIVMQTFENLFSKIAQQNSMILHTHGPWVNTFQMAENQMAGSRMVVFSMDKNHMAE